MFTCPIAHLSDERLRFTKWDHHYDLEEIRMNQKCTLGFIRHIIHNLGAFDSAKNHKRQRRKRQSVYNRQTRRVANANVRIG